jgi:hypothetical protein
MYIIMQNDDNPLDPYNNSSTWFELLADAIGTDNNQQTHQTQHNLFIQPIQQTQLRGTVYSGETREIRSHLMGNQTSFLWREETMEELLQEGLLREELQERERPRSTSPKVSKKRKSKKKGTNQRGLHHTQRYKVRFEEPSIAPAPSVSAESPGEEGRPTEFVNNEYQEFRSGSHPTQIREQEKDSKVRFHKQFW